MKRAKVNTAAPPFDASSPMSVERQYTVTLGNSVVVRFSSERNALAFQAEASRWLTDAMLSANLLLSETHSAYRLAWPYLGEGVAHKGVNCNDELLLATRSLNVVASESANTDHVFRRWKSLGACLDCLRTVALRLRDLYVERTQGVQRHQMEVLVRRCNAMLQELREYGTDVDTSKGYRPSPHRVS